MERHNKKPMRRRSSRVKAKNAEKDAALRKQNFEEAKFSSCNQPHRKKARYCRNQNCKRKRRNRSPFCRGHKHLEAVFQPPPCLAKQCAKKMLVLPLDRGCHERDGIFCANATKFEHYKEIAALARSHHSTLPNSVELQKRTGEALLPETTKNTGIRFMRLMENGEATSRMRELLTYYTKTLLAQHPHDNVIGFMKDPVIVPNPSVINAPRVNSKSNSYSYGTLHRDHRGPETDLLSFEIFLDDVGVDGGPVQIWTESMNKSRPATKQLMEKLSKTSPVVVAEGRSGSLVAFNGRTLHRSMPNSGDRSTLRLHWIVTPRNGTIPERTK